MRRYVCWFDRKYQPDGARFCGQMQQTMERASVPIAARDGGGVTMAAASQIAIIPTIRIADMMVKAVTLTSQFHPFGPTGEGKGG
jgi:hypothetical protein